MKLKIHKEFLTLSVILTSLSAYMLPCHSTDGVRFYYGYPIYFLTLFSTKEAIKPTDTIVMHTSLDLFRFMLNVVIIYLFLCLMHQIFSPRRPNKA